MPPVDSADELIQCRHCPRRCKRSAMRRRRLCHPCYFTPEIRRLYVPESSRGNKVFFWDTDGDVPPPAQATAAVPGSAEKIAALAARVAARQSLFHPDDAGINVSLLPYKIILRELERDKDKRPLGSRGRVKPVSILPQSPALDSRIRGGQCAYWSIMNPGQILLLREATGMTQQEFAKKIGVNLRTVKRWEAGDRKPRGSAAKLLEAFAEEAARLATQRRARAIRLRRKTGKQSLRAESAA